MEYLVDYREITNLIFGMLNAEKVEAKDAQYVANGLVEASLRGVDSHGIRLMPHYMNALAAGRINPSPDYRFSRTAAATGLLDADHAFGHAAGMRAAGHAVDIAKEAGMGAVSVQNSTHYGAAAYFALEISKHDMIGLSFTHSDSLIVPTGGQEKFLGNNPVCFTAPCDGEGPVCLDMATSLITFNKVLQLKEEGKQTPDGVGVDQAGIETTNPADIVSLMPVGGHKGYGLSLMVEVLCALLSGMPFGPHIPKMYNAPIESRRHLGHFFAAIRIDSFTDPSSFKKRMKALADELRESSPTNAQTPVMVAGDPEKKKQKQREYEGIPLRDVDVDFFERAASKYNIPLKIIKNG